MSTRPSMPVTGLAISAVALGAALTLLVPMGATAAAPVSQAEGRLLVATIGGVPSNPVAALFGASAIDANGTGGPVVADTPLDATALAGLVGVTVPTGILIGSGGLIKLGAVGQYAQANDDGSSEAFSGAVAQATNPVLGIGTPTVTAFDAGTTAGDAEIGIGDSVTDAASLNVTLGGLAASALQPATGTAAGHYTLADANIVVGGTTVQAVVQPIDALLAPVFSALTIADPLAGGNVTVSATDLLAAAGVADLNSLAPNTDLVQYLPAAVVAKVTGILTSLNAAIAADPTLGPIAQLLLTPVVAGVTTLLSTVSATLLTPLGTALSGIAQLVVNGQTTNADGSFTETALRVGLGAAGAIASVSLANATVGPNAGPAVTPPGTPGTTPAATLAETGMTLPVGGVLAGAGVLAAAGVALTRVAAWRRRGTHRG
jgi:hypothetical protein